MNSRWDSKEQHVKDYAKIDGHKNEKSLMVEYMMNEEERIK